MLSPELTLQTERLRLIAATLDHLDAERRTPSLLGELLGVALPEDWLPGEYDRDALDYFHERLTAEGAAAAGWYGWYALTLEAGGRPGALVGAAGYMGPPAEGVVEIGYSVLPSARGRGYAAELVAALVRNAFETGAVREVVAHTSDANGPSTRVLLKCGFERVGPGPEPGLVRYRKR